MSIYEKLAKAQMAVAGLEKDGYNAYSKYKYIKEEQVINKARKALLDAGLVSFVTTELVTFDNTTEQKSAVILQTLKVVDTKTGESIEVQMPGHAFDKNGDKAIYKASSGANKYAYIRLLAMPTGEDQENEEAAPQNQPKQNKQSPGPALPPPINNEKQERVEIISALVKAFQHFESSGLPQKQVEAFIEEKTGLNWMNGKTNLETADLFDLQTALEILRESV